MTVIRLPSVRFDAPVLRLLVAVLVMAIVAVAALTLVVPGAAPDARSSVDAAATFDALDSADDGTGNAPASALGVAGTFAAADPAGPAAPDDVRHRQAGWQLTAVAPPAESAAHEGSPPRVTAPRASGAPVGGRALHVLLSVDRT